VDCAQQHDASYTSTFYGAHVEDPSLYHLVIDSTAIRLEACVELLALAAETVCAPGAADG
jgi:cytidylate kinase